MQRVLHQWCFIISYSATSFIRTSFILNLNYPESQLSGHAQAHQMHKYAYIKGMANDLLEVWQQLIEALGCLLLTKTDLSVWLYEWC